MFPAYGGGGPPRHRGQVWDYPPPGGPGPSSFGFMLDRGGPPPQFYGGGGGNRGGGRNNRNKGGDGRHQRGNRDRGFTGGYQQEVVDVNDDEDDNATEGAGRGSKRKRHRSKSPSGSHSSHKRKKRSRSRSPNSRHHHQHRRDNDRDQRDRHQNRESGDSRGGNRNDSRNQRQGSRWDQPQQGHGGYQNQQHNFDRNAGRQQQYPHFGQWNEPPPPGTTPWALDNNPFDQFQAQHFGRGGHFAGPPDRVRRDPHGNYAYQQFQPMDPSEMQERRRVQVSQNFPKKVFLEEVNLQSDFAFRLDTNSNPGQVNHRSIPTSHKSTYDGGVGKGIFGASEDEISKVYSKFHSFRCKLPDNVNDGAESEDSQESVEDGEGKTKSKSEKRDSLASNFISLDKEGDSTDRRNSDGRMDTGRDFDSYSFERKDGEMSIKEKVEYYNKEVRNQPQNIELWKEFVQFQDKVFEESNQIYEQAEDNYSSSSKQGKKKNKSNRKALLEKKVSILEKALESNPKNLSLHLMRLECLLELYKPRHVLTEWKKLVAQYQHIAPFWTEYILFSSSQLLIYSNSTIMNVFDSCFQKFHLMMNPQYPDFQRPKKFPLFISDITFGLSLLLRNAGYLEKAVALHQAQLEFDFYCPKSLFKDETLLNWKENVEVFETFWDAGTPKFGEKGAKGWLNVLENVSSEQESIAVSDSSITDFEECTFDYLNAEIKARFQEQEENNEGASLIAVKQMHKPNIWLNMESCRSKLYWLPWRKSCSDVDDCEDAQRVVLASDISNFLCPLPTDVNFITDFGRQAAHFRHIINFLMTLREDFIPHTQSVDLVCSPFVTVSLTESSSLFSEIYYWRRLADLYVGINNSEPASKAHHVFAPEGFKILDMTLPNVTSAPVLRPTIFELSLRGQDENLSEEADEKKSALLKENDEKFMEMFHRVLESGLELLEPEFSCVLFQMFLRFEQKLTCTRSDVKKRIKFAKGLMKHDSIRNSIGGYRELAMLEYFGGKSAQKAIDLLIKSINVTGKSLNLEEWDQVDWEKDWKSVVDLISLYRQLVELYLYQGDSTNDSKAYYTLVQLGNGFHSLEPDTLELDEEQQWKPKTNALLKATRQFEKNMAMLIPNFTLKSETESENENDTKDKVKNDVYFKWGGENCVEFFLQKKNIIVEWTSLYALFQFFAKDFDSASHIYENMLGRLSNEQLYRRDSYNPELIRVHIREQLYVNWCNLAAKCLVKDPLMNSKFRNILGRALEEFPSSPPLLLLFTDVENQTSVAGKLWRLMMANMKQDSDKVLTHWPPLIMGIGLARKIEELEHDEEVGLPCFGLGGPAVPQDTIFYKLDSMISIAERHPGARHCPLLWRVHLKLLALRAREGKDVQRAKEIFYEAIRHCPSSKALYLDGVTYFPDKLQEVNDLFAEKQLLIRLPIEELDVLLDMEEDVELVKKSSGLSENEQEDEVMVVDSIGKRGKVGGGKKSRESRSDGEIADSE